ncbi:MAG: GTP-binding protein [Candidatus Heimdallarchaeota archaeon]|nr:GTP-binding protein [Candidatus Heimdallarchaeota archaeon]
MDNPGKAIRKIVLLGDASKSEIMRTFSDKVFIEDHLSTLGANFSVKYVTTPMGKELELQIWDISNSLEFFDLRKRFYNGAKAAILVFDVSRPDSLQILFELVSDLIKTTPTPIALVGNFSQIQDDAVHVLQQDVKDYADELTKLTLLEVPYIEVDIKTRKGEKEVNKFLQNIENYQSLLMDFTSNERQQLLLAKSLYDKVKQDKLDNPNLDDVIKYMEINIDLINTEFNNSLDPYELP